MGGVGFSIYDDEVAITGFVRHHDFLAGINGVSMFWPLLQDFFIASDCLRLE